MPTTTQSEQQITIEQAKHSKRSLGEDAVPARGHSCDHVPADYRQVNGWGADLDPANRPMFPKELPSDVKTVRGHVTSWQVPRSKIHISNEQPNLTPTFGENVPPKGLSGMLRDYAYEFGEATNRHWMTLILADRVDIVESMVADLFRGKPDNYVREKGWLAYTQSDEGRKRAMTVGAAALGALAVGLVLTKAIRRTD